MFRDHLLGGFGLFMFIRLLIFLLIFIGAIYLIVFLLNKYTKPSASGKDEALNILRERFARGEIDEFEYREKKRILEEEK